MQMFWKEQAMEEVHREGLAAHWLSDTLSIPKDIKEPPSSEHMVSLCRVGVSFG